MTRRCSTKTLISAHRFRRGGIYFAVIGVSMLVALIGLGAMAAVRAQRLTVVVSTDTIEARDLALSAVELGAYGVSLDSTWRSARPNGRWITGRALGDGVLDIEGYDPVDNSISNRPTDRVTIRGIGRKGKARQMLEATLAASGLPMDAHEMALHTAGQLRVESGMRLTVTGAPASTNSTVRNDGIIDGNVECRGFDSLGVITGTTNPLANIKPMPDPGLVALYANLGTAMNPPGIITNALISPESNPWGATNAEGVYVITSSSDITIRNIRLYGTLVIIAPGKKVTIDSLINMQPVRKDYPVLIVDGNLTLSYNSALTMSEATIGVNLNPPRAPYNGADNQNTSDSFPVEICGLVHARGQVEIIAASRIRGGLIAEAIGSSAVRIGSNPEIIYDSQFRTSPIMGYMKSVTMRVVPGTWRQAVEP